MVKKAPPGEDGADVRKEFCGEAVPGGLGEG